MDARQIAALARAGLTDDQIETVVRVTAAPAQPSTPEAPTREHSPISRGQVVRRDPQTVTDTGDPLEMVCRCLRPAIVARGGSVTGTLRDIQEATGVRIASKNRRGSYSLIGLGNAISARITAGGGMYVCHGVAWVRGPQMGYHKDRVWEIAAV